LLGTAVLLVCNQKYGKSAPLGTCPLASLDHRMARAGLLLSVFQRPSPLANEAASPGPWRRLLPSSGCFHLVSITLRWLWRHVALHETLAQPRARARDMPCPRKYSPLSLHPFVARFSSFQLRCQFLRTIIRNALPSQSPQKHRPRHGACCCQRQSCARASQHLDTSYLERLREPFRVGIVPQPGQ
jgi:hypothetical protein